MKINVGSTSKLKIKAILDTIKLYPKLFPEPEIAGIDVKVPLFGHPKNLKETTEGAVKRAKKAFVNCSYSFGIEGGLIEMPHTNSGFMETGVCAAYVGKEIYLGLAPAFEWPHRVNELILGGTTDASRAFYQLGFTSHKKLGAVKGGIIGFLTDNKITREDFIKYSIFMALVKLENSRLYYQ